MSFKRADNADGNGLIDSLHRLANLRDQRVRIQRRLDLECHALRRPLRPIEIGGAGGRIAHSFILGVFHHTHNLVVLVILIFSPPFEFLADRVTLAEEIPCHRLIDDCHLGGRLGILRAEIAAEQQRRPEGFKEIWRYGVEIHPCVFVRAGRVTLDRNGVIPAAAPRDGRYQRQAGAADAGNRLNPLQRLPVKLQCGRGLIAMLAGVERKEQDVFPVEPRIDVFELRDGPHKESRAEQKQH